MIKYLLFVALVVLLGILIALLNDNSRVSKMPKSKKIALIGCILSIIILGGVYTFLQDNDSEKIHHLKTAFLRGEKLECVEDGGKKFSADSKNFNLVSGVNSLQGDKNSKFQGVILQLEKCKISESNEAKNSLDSENLDSQNNASNSEN